MSSFFLSSIDLISKEKIKGSLEDLKKKIFSLEEGNDLGEMISEVIQKTKDGRVEIYAEDIAINRNSEEEILSFVKLVEKELGGCIPGSTFEIEKEIPTSTVRWIKTEYSWEPDSTEEESWGEESYWEDKWDEWNEEWN